MEILRWKIDPALEQEAVENYRTAFALNLKDKDPLHVIRELTFDGTAPSITISDIDRIFDFVEDKLLRKRIVGVGLEVGAGPLVFSSILAKRPQVEKVYGVEICRSIIENLAPDMVNFILGSNDSKKSIGVVGSFDQIELPSQSVDFIFDFYSLHHSLDLNITLKECARVLRPGGFVLCFDKARPDSYDQKDLDVLMDSEYGDDYKKQFGLPLDRKITRRMNGEREYRLRDWENYFKNAGFSVVDYYYLEKTLSGNMAGKLLKSFLSLLPPAIQSGLNYFMPKPKSKHKFELEAKNRVFSRLVNPFRKEICVIVGYKP